MPHLRLAALSVLVLSAALLPAQLTATSTLPPSLTAVPVMSWITAVAANERAVIRPTLPIRYLMHSRDEKGDHIRDIIESKDGVVARLIAIENKPLTPEQDELERARLNATLNSPSEFARHHKRDEQGKDLALRLLALMPEAMTYTYTPGQPQEPDFPGLQIVIDFKPNPNWQPPSTTSEALTGLEGRLWIDAETKHMVRMEGHIAHPVNLGWGILVRIAKGGLLELEQRPGPNGRWVFSHFVERLSARALMVKTVNTNSTFDSSNPRPIAPMSYQDAIHELLNTPLPKSFP